LIAKVSAFPSDRSGEPPLPQRTPSLSMGEFFPRDTPPFSKRRPRWIRGVGGQKNQNKTQRFEPTKKNQKNKKNIGPPLSRISDLSQIMIISSSPPCQAFPACLAKSALKRPFSPSRATNSLMPMVPPFPPPFDVSPRRQVPPSLWVEGLLRISLADSFFQPFPDHLPVGPHFLFGGPPFLRSPPITYSVRKKRVVVFSC